jgi:hypothetical protein
MNKYIPDKKDLYGAVGMLAAGVLIFVAAIIAVSSKISTIYEESMQAETVAIGIEEAFIIKKDLAELHDEVSILNSYFIQSGDEVRFIEKLESVARASNVKIEISSIAVGKEPTQSAFTENLGMRIRFEGDRASIHNFLKRMESMPHAVSLGNFSFELLVDELWSGQIEVSVLKIKDA